MICKVKGIIEKYSLLENVKSVAVALSGGADSICLLHILSRIKEDYGIILKAVHVNHNLRGENADRDEEYVRKICAEMGVELLVFSVDVRKLSKEKGLGLEECGRLVRYECFQKANCDATATAHTLSDSIETMIFNLIRGTGIKGLCSIPYKREPDIIRPLIECTRQEIEAYCKENSLEYMTDESNLSDDYTRNYIRHNIVPLFEKVNPNFEASLLRAMQNLSSDNDFLEVSVRALLEEASFEGGYHTKVLKKAHPSIRTRAISSIISKEMKKPPESRHIELVDRAVVASKGKIELAKDLYISVNSDIISFQANRKNEESFLIFEKERGRYNTPMGVFSLEVIENPDEILAEDIDFEKLQCQYSLTTRKAGDIFYSKKRGNTKTLKKLFNELKIPAEKRGLIPVLRVGESVAWVFGIGTDGRFLANKGTRKILRIKKED